MGTQRYCDVCKSYRMDRQGHSTIHRYGLSRQLPVPGKMRPNRPNSQAFKRERHYGSIDLCDQCWKEIAEPKTRPELRGKTHPKRIEAEALTQEPDSAMVLTEVAT